MKIESERVGRNPSRNPFNTVDSVRKVKNGSNVTRLFRVVKLAMKTTGADLSTNGAKKEDQMRIHSWEREGMRSEKKGYQKIMNTMRKETTDSLPKILVTVLTPIFLQMMSRGSGANCT